MARKQSTQPKVVYVRPGTLTQEDVDETLKAVRAWGRKARKSKASAIAALAEIGILTPSGRLAKRYRQ